MYRNAIVLLGLLAGLLAVPALAHAQKQATREVVDSDVDHAIERTKRWLYARQRDDGNWPNFSGQARGVPTAFALFGLLEAGENPESPRIRKGLDALAGTAESKHTHLVSLRLMVFAQVGGLQNETYAKVYKEDLEWLLKDAVREGAWTVDGAARDGDNFSSQFALLALREVSRAGREIDARIIRTIERKWLGRQNPDGGWTYAGTVGTTGDSIPSMTAAGITSLYICDDANAGGACRPYPHARVIERGLDFLGKSLKPDFYDEGYLALCVQRVGMTSGLKFIGDMDWYAVGAREMVKPRPYGPRFGGMWGPDIKAALELTFLARGRIPLTFNKLAWGEQADWNAHPRDVARFAEYMRRNFERRMRWQVVSIKDDIRMLLDAPILMITGRKALTFSDQQWDKLREYSLRGGTLLFMPTHVSVPFVDAVKEKLTELYAEQAKAAPGYFKLEQVPADHEVYKTYKPIANGDKKLPLWGVSDGSRLVAIVGETDLGCAWQRYMVRGMEDHFTLGVNLWMYATGANNLGSRMRPVFVGSDRPSRETVKVGWVRHGGNWHTQPYALDYLSQKLQAENFVKIDLAEGVVPGKDDLSKLDLLWITGTDKAEWPADQVASLRAYLDGGGTIYCNAIGGSEAFNKSIDQLVAALSAGRGGTRLGAPPGGELMTGKLGEHRGLPLDDLKRARNWKVKDNQGGAALQVYVEGGQPRIIISTNGVHDTLDGHITWSAMSYMPADAGQIAANVVLQAMMDIPPPPKPEPTTAPDETEAEPEPAPHAPRS